MTDLKIYAKTLEDSAKEQINAITSSPAFADFPIRIMPDCHAGKGCVIGFTAPISNGKIIPNIVGVDIGCGVASMLIPVDEIDFEKLDKVIHDCIPSGRNVHNTPLCYVYTEDLHCYNELKELHWLQCSMGTLGSGNHYIEIGRSEATGQYYLIVHTGSRNLGKQVAEIYQKKAIKHCSESTSKKEVIPTIVDILKHLNLETHINDAIKYLKTKENENKTPDDLCYLEGKDYEDYLDDMRYCQEWAYNNRFEIIQTIFDKMGWEFCPTGEGDYIESVHNYIDNKDMIRKGAISAHKDEGVIIPLSMAAGHIIGRGLGNADWNYSAPHGAGRLMSRSEARKTLSLDDYSSDMEGIYTSCINESTIDECPRAYKDPQEIMSLIDGQTIEIIDILKPVYNFKAGE